MKYKFIFDENFESNVFLNLTTEELGVVLSTVIGKHNALFFGYKPERLITAIKKLSSGQGGYIIADDESLTAHDISFFNYHFVTKVGEGTIIVPNINSNKSMLFYDTLRIASENNTRKCNIVVYDTDEPNMSDEYYRLFLENFDIVYKCKEVVPVEMGVEAIPMGVSLKEARSRLKSTLEYRRGLDSGKYYSGMFTSIDTYWSTCECYKKFSKLREVDGVMSKVQAKKFMKVARSISDIRQNNLTTVSDLDSAMNLYYKAV